MIEFPQWRCAQPELHEEFEREQYHERSSIASPWKILDRMTNLLRPGALVVLGGYQGFGKTLFCQQIAWEFCKPSHHGVGNWYYLMLEERKIDFQRRMLAHISGLWGVLADRPEEAAQRQEIAMQHSMELDEMDRHVLENPLKPVKVKGKMVVPELSFKEVLEWVTAALAGEDKEVVIRPGRPADFGDAVPPLKERRTRPAARVVFIDSLSFISFGSGSQKWDNQDLFARQLAGLVESSQGTVIVVAHIRKQRGADQDRIPTADDIREFPMLPKLAKTVILLYARREMESEIFRAGGLTDTAKHNRLIAVDKARYGDGTGQKLAMNLAQVAFEEIGIIAPKKGKKNETPF